MLNVVMMSAIMHNVSMLGVIMLSVLMLSVLMLSVLMLSVSFLLLCYYLDSCCDMYHYAECRGTNATRSLQVKKVLWVSLLRQDR